jgi:hypothetical protein
MLKHFLFGLALAVLLSAPAARATAGHVDFEDGASLGGTAIGNHYQALGVTFSNGIWITPAFTGFTNNEFWAGNAGLGVQNGVQNPNPWAFSGTSSPIVATFSGPVTKVSIDAFDVGVNGAGLHAFNSQGQMVATDQAQGGDIGLFNNVTLTVTGTDIRSIQLDQPFYSGFPDGIGWDNLNFTSASAVPEPGSLTLAGVCLGGLAVRVWRKRRVAG